MTRPTGSARARPDVPAVADHGQRARSGGQRLSVCLYTPSVAPSGMGGHMVDLAAELVDEAEVTVLAWATPAGQRVLHGAAAVGATPVPLPRPRDPAFGGVVERAVRHARADVFHVHVGTGRENFDGARAARRAGAPAVVETVHMPWQLGSHKHRRPLFASLEPVDRLIAVSDLQRRTYERIGVPPERFSAVLNGIRPRGPGPGGEAARRSLGLDPARPVVLTVGRLVAQKGHRTLVDAVPALSRAVPGVAVVIVGDGHLRGALEDRVRELGVSGSVVLAGHRHDARWLLDAADVFVLPSRQEAMPLAVLEAMDAGLPVVATRVFGSAELVLDGETGLLVPVGDAPALARALAALLTDPSRARRLAAAGRARFLDRFTADRMAAETLAVYREVLERETVRRGA